MNIQTELRLVQQLACGERSDPIKIVQLLQNVPAAEISQLLARLPPAQRAVLVSYLPAPLAFREETERDREIKRLRTEINRISKQITPEPARARGLQITRENRSRGERVPPTPTAQTQLAREALATVKRRREIKRSRATW